YLRGKVTEVCDDGTGKVVVHPCGTTLPPIFADVAAGVVQITFPDALWDAPMIPDYNTTLTTGFAPGDTLALAKAAGLVGISLTAEDATWPTPAQTATITCKDGKSKADCFPDMDGDGKPGITVKMKTDGTPPNPGYTSGAGPWKYSPAPT